MSISNNVRNFECKNSLKRFLLLFAKNQAYSPLKSPVIFQKREHPLNNPTMFEGPNTADVETHCSKDHFCMHPCNCRDHGMSRFKNGLDNGVRSLARRSFS